MSSNLRSRDQPPETSLREDSDPDAMPHGKPGHGDTESSRAPAAKRAREFLARRDPLAWVVAATAFLLGVGFVGVNLAYNGGNFIPPLDDVYIHLQYASQIGQGHFLQYNTGDPVSTGASSMLYVLVLGAFYAMGVSGTAFLPFAMGFGLLCFSLTSVCAYRIGSRIVNRQVGAWAGLLVAANGVLLWGAVSGMEIGFVALLITSSVLAFTIEAPNERFVLTPLVGTLAALARPEAFFFTAVLGIAMVWTALRKPRNQGASAARALGRLVLVPLPFLAYAGQKLLYRITTGTTSANGMQAKSLLYNPITYFTDVVDETLSRFHGFLTVFSGLNTFDYVFPGALIAAMLGTVYVVREKPAWRPLVLAMAGGLLLVLLAISTLKTAHTHHLRYVQPFMPILLLLAVTGLYALAGLLRARRSRLLVVNFAFTMTLVFSLFQMPAWSIRLGQQSAGIRGQQVSINNWIQGHLPSGAVIAVNDVGAPAYFTDHYIVDLIGLTTNELTVPNVHGPGSLYEALLDMPEQRRPDYFSIFDNWSVHGLKEAGVFGDAPVITFQLKSPRYSHRPAGTVCQSTGVCDEVVIYEADWSNAGSGDRPAEVRPPGRIRDHVDVADLASEQAHSYRVKPAHNGFQPLTSVRTVGYDGREVVDSGRHVIGGEVMTASNLTPGRPVTITSRISATRPLPDTYTGSREVQVSVNGQDVGLWRFEAGDEGWYESTFTIPGELVRDSTLTVELGPVQTFLGPYPDYTSYGYWFSQ